MPKVTIRPSRAASAPRSTAARKARAIGDHVVGRRQQQQRLRLGQASISAAAIAAGAVFRACGSISRPWAVSPASSQLVGDDEAVILGRDDQGCCKAWRIKASRRGLKQAFGAEKRHELLGKACPRHRPEPRARPAAKQNGRDQPGADPAARKGVDGLHSRVPSILPSLRSLRVSLWIKWLPKGK